MTLVGRCSPFSVVLRSVHVLSALVDRMGEVAGCLGTCGVGCWYCGFVVTDGSGCWLEDDSLLVDAVLVFIDFFFSHLFLRLYRPTSVLCSGFPRDHDSLVTLISPNSVFELDTSCP